MDIIRALLSRSGSPGEENNRGRVTTSATYCSLRHSVELRNPPDNDDYVQDNGDTRDKNHADKDSDGQLRSDITQTRTTVDDDVTSILSIPVRIHTSNLALYTIIIIYIYIYIYIYMCVYVYFHKHAYT